MTSSPSSTCPPTKTVATPMTAPGPYCKAMSASRSWNCTNRTSSTAAQPAARRIDGVRKGAANLVDHWHLPVVALADLRAYQDLKSQRARTPTQRSDRLRTLLHHRLQRSTVRR